MTTRTTSPPPEGVQKTPWWPEIAVGFAREMAEEWFKRGDLAGLRRMDPDNPDAAAFWRLMASEDLLGNPGIEQKWGLVLHGIALMTRTAGTDRSSRSAHDRSAKVGKALFEGGDPGRGQAFYSPQRFNRLLTARGPMLRTLLARMFRMMGAAGQPFDWYQMAQLILGDNERSDKIRHDIARDYYWAENRAQRPES